MPSHKVAVVILAAGKGTRMAHQLPKVLVSVKGKPMLPRLLTTVKKLGLGKPFIVIGNQKNLIKQAVGNEAVYVEQRRQLGTGHAAAAVKKILRGKFSEILVWYGDSPFISKRTIQRLIKLRRKHNAAMSLLTIKLPDYRGARKSFMPYGRIVRDRSGKLLERCVEYKDATAKQKLITEVNSGAYCFAADWLWQNLPKIKRRTNSGEYYLTDLMAMAVSQGKLVVPVTPKDWREGIGVNSLLDKHNTEKYFYKKS